jgi:hypothetical protein
MTNLSLDIGRVAARIGCASQGKYLIEDVLICPDYDHESVTWPGLARWDTVRQRFELMEVLPGAEPRCGCGRTDLETAPLFFTARRISLAAIEALSSPPTASEPVGHFCQACGSDDLVRCVTVWRDPVLDLWRIRGELEQQSRCLACGHDDLPRIERLFGEAKAAQKRAARLALARDEEMRKVVQKLASYVGGTR